MENFSSPFLIVYKGDFSLQCLELYFANVANSSYYLNDESQIKLKKITKNEAIYIERKNTTGTYIKI